MIESSETIINICKFDEPVQDEDQGARTTSCTVDYEQIFQPSKVFHS